MIPLKCQRSNLCSYLHVLLCITYTRARVCMCVSENLFFHHWLSLKPNELAAWLVLADNWCRQKAVLCTSTQITDTNTLTHELISEQKGKLKENPTSAFNWPDCRPTIKGKQAQSFPSILFPGELLISRALHSRKWNGAKRSTWWKWVWILVINCVYLFVMHALWILAAEWGGVLSYSMVTVENLYVPDKPAGILLSKYTMLLQKITEV